MTLHRHRDLPAIGRAAADELKLLVERALADGPACHLALSGGHTPTALFTELVARGPGYLPWDAIHLWWVDERAVPPDHAESNFGMAKAKLIDPLRLPAARLHRMRGEDDPEAAARAYEAELRAALGDHPAMTVAFMGIGADGHTASIFPDTTIDPDRLVMASSAPSGQPRITMTPELLNASRHVRFLVTGAAKAHALAGIIDNKGNYPAKLIQNADLVWHVDDDAAQELA